MPVDRLEEVDSDPRWQQVAGAEVGTDARRRQVAKAVTRWTDQLIDLSGRNQLLYHRTLKTGTLDLAQASAPSLAALLSEMPVRLSQLFPDAPHSEEALARGRGVHRRAQAHFEERGIDTLFLALGMATWTTSTSSATPAAPVLLRPVRLQPRGAARNDFDVRLHGDWQVNGTLLHLLRTEFAVHIDPDDLLALLDTTTDLDTAPLFGELAETAADVPGFAVADAAIIGTFAYTKLPMVADLRDNIAQLAAHDLIAAVAGVEGAQEALRELRRHDVDASRPDTIPPDEEFLILDADASQHAAVNAALDGQPVIIQGPPGTGKSQTIANLIASLSARGMRALFVAEKRAAIEAVTTRLDRAGLADLVMDLHGGVTSKRALAEELGATVERIGRVPATEYPELHHELETNRAALAAHSAALHEPRDPWELSLFTVNQRLLGLPGDAVTTLRFTGTQLTELDAATARAAREALTEWVTLSEPLISEQSAWTGAVVTTREDARAALDLVTELAHSTVAAAVDHLDRIRAVTDLPTPPTIDAWCQPLAVLRGIAQTAMRFDEGVFDLDLDPLIDALDPAAARWPRRAMAHLFDRTFREARQTLLARWVGAERPGVAELRDAALEARNQLTLWRQLGGTEMPTPPADLDAAVAAHETLLRRLAALNEHMGRRDLTVRPHDRLTDDLEALLSDEITLFRLPRAYELEAWLADHHLTTLVRAVKSGDIDPANAAAVFHHAWLESIRATITAHDPRLSDFDGALAHERAMRFRAADARHIEVTAERVRRAVAEHATRVRDRHADQDDLLARQVRRRRGHLSLRALFEQAPDVLTALRPCWAMSPLVVSQTLPPTQLFDVVIFDEASQVLPADAVPALLRAPQAVIAGDRRQLPPTTFFDATADDEPDDDDDGGLTVGFESILDVLDTVLRSYLLTWHYRSRSEPLIAFANHHVYNGRLTTFPGARITDCLRHEAVRQRPGATDTRSNDVEVRRVVDLMIEHARTRPEETLGVIALGRYHAGRIEAALRERLDDLADRSLDAFFDDTAPERAFVKNLERVQGDERDAIILTIGYGRGADGQLRYRFGPLLTDGGERRLNVAITRARQRLTLVSSFTHADMDPGRSAAAGVTLLRRYLRYVESGGQHLDEVSIETDVDPLTADIAAHLEHIGLPVTAAHGSSGLRIDVAVAHPHDPDRMVLAVEADGPGYQAAATTRDRDRLRREALHRLGWRHHRVWSTDWCRDPVAQTHAIAMAYDEACREIDGFPGRERSDDEEAGDEAAPLHLATAGTPVRQGRRPVIRAGTPITAYSQQELVGLVRWVTSDTLLRTEEQLIDELMAELGYQRRGPRIVEALTAAIRAA